ncbi:MAG: hypothetical protein IJO11_05080 [Alphaproteobacteria bacterium]|nr:hypothetical protein [Alphaproteobacteria bacterium]
MQTKINELGRSMVEILGVLAVIGVLSVGGIIGYKYAMDKYRTNDIVESVHMRSTDIWHIYHDTKKTLPETEPGVDAFPEYGETTKTGFPIMITSHLDVAFKIWVDEVPNNICKQVLGQNLNQYVKGLKYIQVNGLRYEGNLNICPKDDVAQMVFTSFINTDGSTREEGDSQRCAENEDCDSCCGTPYCDTKSMTCVDECTTKGQVCNPDGCGCVDCVQDSDCPSNNPVCDVTRNICVKIPPQCGEGENFGKEFRAANGACVKCSNMGSVIIMNSDDNEGIFESEVGGITVKDTHSGREMCLACTSPEHRVEEAGSGDNLKTYCATGCVKGVSFLSKSNGCVKCDSSNEPTIPNDDQAFAQCAACSNRVWLRPDPRSGGNSSCVLKDCPEGYFKNSGKCRKCKLDSSTDCYGANWPACFDYYAAKIWHEGFQTSAGSLKSQWESECLACATTSNEALREKHQLVTISEWLGKATYCPRACDPNTFQSHYGTCYPCDTDEKPEVGLNGGVSSYIKSLCEACGRVIDGSKCAKVDSATCGNNQFRGVDKCYDCTHPAGVTVESEEACEICGNQRSYDSTRKICYNKCGTGYFQTFTGACISCDDIGNGYNMGYQDVKSDVILNVCTTGCGEGKTEYSNGSVYGYYYCRPTDCGTGNIHGDEGCTTCPTSGKSKLANSQTECEACGNHIYLNGYCVYYKPGTSGVCNNDSPDTTKYPNYTTGIYYRDNTGICRRCDSQTSAYKATAEECASCGGIRMMVDGTCQYNGCTENETFLTFTGCKSCETDDIKVAIPSTESGELYCTGCNRRIMRVNSDKSTTNAYCVPTCSSDEWQDVDGSCHIKEIDTQTNEIGADEESQSLCLKSGRFVYQEGFKFYCEQEAE